MPIFPCFLWGAFGGLIPVVANLLVNEGYPFTEYWAVGASAPVVKSMLFHLFQIAVFFVLGGIWAHLNKAADALKAFQLGIAAPAVVIGMVAANDAKKAKVSDPQLKSETNLSIKPAQAAIFPLEFPGLLIKSQIGDGLSEILPVEDLPKLFGGIERRLASDKLITLYPTNKTAVVEVVIKAIQPDSLATSYRVNIYVARTLRLIPGKWEGTQAQRDAIRALTAQRNYRDPTFKENVDGAWENWKQASSQ